MANRVNYAKLMDKVIEGLGEQRPRLLLHACCAPCSSGVLDQLCDHFELTILFYNPNIWPLEEYDFRAQELARFLREAEYRGIELVCLPHDPSHFFDRVHGLENEPEGGARCTVCYELRMREAAAYAAAHGFEWFTTTLSVSPLKDPVRINTIGEALAAEYGVRHLPSEFRKKEGYIHSLKRSKEFGLYRQDYCGCIYSLEERRRQKAEKEAGKA